MITFEFFDLPNLVVDSCILLTFVALAFMLIPFFLVYGETGALLVLTPLEFLICMALETEDS